MALELARMSDITYFKNKDEHEYFLSDPSYFKNAIRYVDTYFTSYLEASGNSVILDRALPSEYVYSHVLNRPTDMSVLEALDARHAALGTKIIIPFRTDYSMCKDDYQIVNKTIKSIHDRYHEFAKWSKCDILLLNVDDEDLDREMTEIFAFLGLAAKVGK